MSWQPIETALYLARFLNGERLCWESGSGTGELPETYYFWTSENGQLPSTMINDNSVKDAIKLSNKVLTAMEDRYRLISRILTDRDSDE